VAKSGSEIAPNFVPILWILQPCPNRGLSQYINTPPFLALAYHFICVISEILSSALAAFSLIFEKYCACGG
jgi:hypothetical protein